MLINHHIIMKTERLFKKIPAENMHCCKVQDNSNLVPRPISLPGETILGTKLRQFKYF